MFMRLTKACFKVQFCNSNNPSKQYIMKAFLSYSLATCFAILIFLTSCKKDASSPEGGGGDDNPSTNTIKGTIYDAQGNTFQIPGAKVVVHALGDVISIGDDPPVYNFSMDNNSHYGSKVVSDLYSFHARAYMPLNGKTVCIDLAPVDGKPFDYEQASKPGIVKDFKLMLTGLMPGGDPNNLAYYCGAHINFTDGAYNFTSEGYWTCLSAKYPGAKVVFNFAIAGPLLDGSEGQSQQIAAPVEAIKTGQWIIGIPLAAYRLTATLVTQDGSTMPLRLNQISTAGSDINAHYDYVNLTFPPDPEDMDGHPLDPHIAVWEN